MCLLQDQIHEKGGRPLVTLSHYLSFPSLFFILRFRMALFSFSLYNIASLTAALHIMHLVSLLASAFAGTIAHHSRIAASRRPSPQTLSRFASLILRLLLVLTIPIALVSLLLVRLSQILLPRRHPTSTSPSQRILLTTNASTTNTAQTIALARALHAAGHDITVATTAAPSALPSPATFSTAVSSSHNLRRTNVSAIDPAATYEHDVLGAIFNAIPSIWIPCDILAASPTSLPPLLDTIDQLRETLAREAQRRAPRARCRVLAPSGALAHLVRDRGAFVEFVAGLTRSTGVAPVEKAAVVRTRWEVHQKLHEARRNGRGREKRFVLERLGGAERVIVPLGTSMNETYDCVAGLDISRARPWAMWERVEGEVYRAHAVVVRGVVRAFAVARADGRAARVFLAAGAPLHASFLAFVEAFVAAVPDGPSAPVAIDFVVRTGRTETGTASRIHPMCCSWDALPISAAPFAAAMVELVEQSRVLASDIPKAGNGDSNGVNDNQKPSRFVHGTTTPPDSPALKAVDRFVASTALPTPPSSPARTSASPRQKVLQDAHQPERSKPAAAVLPPSVTGVYSLPYSLLVYLLLPILELLRQPSRSALAAIVRGYAVVVDRVLLPGAWAEELWDRDDAGPWIWEWGVRRVVMAREVSKA